jgi:LysM repeat protein
MSVETRTGDISSGIVIYFANEGESLWDIAKRYAVPKERIGRYNNLDDTDRLERSVKLFIPSVI